MLATVTTLLTESAKRLNLSDAQLTRLLTPNKVHEFTIRLNNGKQFRAYRSQHSNARGPYKGGIRFHPEVNKEEVVALSILMSLKTALAGIPLGGGKGGVAVNPKELSDEELEELSRKYVQYLVDYIGPEKDIPAPDVQTNPKIIDWMVDEYSVLTGDATRASFTGKSLENGGSQGREEATGRGGLIVAKELLASAQSPKASYAIQGFGNVGTFFALAAQELCPDWIMSVAADSKAVIKAPSIIPQDLMQYKKANGVVSDYPGSTSISTNELLYGEYDMLVLAALGGIITHENANGVKARIVIELANGPVTDKASDILTSKGIKVVPDILANAGGVIVSYFEWLQNMNGQKWSRQDVLEKLDTTILEATDEVMRYSEQSNTTLKQAAIDVSVKRLLKL